MNLIVIFKGFPVSRPASKTKKHGRAPLAGKKCNMPGGFLFAFFPAGASRAL